MDGVNFSWDLMNWTVLVGVLGGVDVLDVLDVVDVVDVVDVFAGVGAGKGTPCSPNTDIMFASR
jgi:hypothetical protein